MARPPFLELASIDVCFFCTKVGLTCCCGGPHIELFTNRHINQLKNVLFSFRFCQILVFDFGSASVFSVNCEWCLIFLPHMKRWREKTFGSGGIRTHASEETGALNQRLRPLGHATSAIQGARLMRQSGVECLPALS